MRTLTRTLSGLALLLAVGVAGAQQPGQLNPDVEAKPKKSALEEALDMALKNNPDLRVAASKLALADAELSRTRLQVTQKVAAAYADVLTQRAILKELERQLAQIRQSGSASREELGKAELPVVEMKAKVAAAERELDNLQGKGGGDVKSAGATLGRLYLTRGLSTSSIDLGIDPFVNLSMGTNFDFGFPITDGSDKLRQALRKDVTLSGQKMPLTDYLALVKKTAGVSIQADTRGAAWKETVDFDFEQVPVGGMLQFLEDNLTGYQVVVREYGLAIVPKEKVPPHATTLTAFLHAGGEKEKPNPTPKGDKEIQSRR